MLFVGQRPHVHRVELEAGDRVRVGIDHEHVPVGRDRDVARARGPGKRARRTERDDEERASGGSRSHGVTLLGPVCPTSPYKRQSQAAAARSASAAGESGSRSQSSSSSGTLRK